MYKTYYSYWLNHLSTCDQDMLVWWPRHINLSGQDVLFLVAGTVDLITAISRRTAPPVRTLISDRRSGRATTHTQRKESTSSKESTVGKGQGRIARM